MKVLSTILVALGVTQCTQAWLASPQSQRSLTSLQLSTAVSPDAYVKPGRIVMDDLPTLYVYDHCPFCVRVRLAFGIKNIKHQLYFMANDDIPTPTSLVGKKIAPIFVSFGLPVRTPLRCLNKMCLFVSVLDKYVCNRLTQLLRLNSSFAT